MSELPPGLRPAQTVQCILADGTVFRGPVEAARRGWIRLGTDQGPVLLNAAHIACIRGEGAAAASLGLGPVEDDTPKPAKRGTAAKTDDWDEDQLRTLADGFLDGHDDGELASRLGQSRGQIKTLRQAFECARGNLVDDEIAPTARPWIGRWREVLSG